jgi:hypothetical protein
MENKIKFINRIEAEINKTPAGENIVRSALTMNY